MGCGVSGGTKEGEGRLARAASAHLCPAHITTSPYDTVVVAFDPPLATVSVAFHVAPGVAISSIQCPSASALAEDAGTPRPVTVTGAEGDAPLPQTDTRSFRCSTPFAMMLLNVSAEVAQESATTARIIWDRSACVLGGTAKIVKGTDLTEIPTEWMSAP